ncbi:cilia- and flagella-associated protein 300 [Chanos chanos]|uniref:Cilia- and flagella-associated protein 300 n=1 Tax=Chanos chanos TaxID=29144 RepID=A0A6J2W3T6_CHACN|nr:cilia- and flagella-associated protein 300 [Chanos chanos]
MKWSMLGRITAQTFNFDQTFYPYRKNDFALNFFQDSCVQNNLKMIDFHGLWRPLDRDIMHVDTESVPCTKVSTEIFDPIFKHGIIHSSGRIVKCYHDFYADFDELRKMLLEEDSENFNVIPSEDRQEFLFRLFKHICVGGELNQYEDVISPYIKTAKKMYKDLVSVQKDPETKEMKVVSTVMKVLAYDKTGVCYPSEQNEEQSFAYLCVDPLKRHVHVLYHSYGLGLSSHTTALSS